MRAARLDADQHVAVLYGPAVDDLGLFDHTDGEAGEIVIALRVHARHLGGLTAHKRATRLATAFADAGDDLRIAYRIELGGREVVEKEQRLRAAGDDVVHAHRHEIDADGVVTIELDRELELGADAICAGDQHRFLVLTGRNLE